MTTRSHAQKVGPSLDPWLLVDLQLSNLRHRDIVEDGCVSHEPEELGEHLATGAWFYVAVFCLSDDCLCAGT